MKTQNDTIKNTSAASLQEKRAREERKRAFESEKQGLKTLFLILFGAVALLSLITLLLTLFTDVVFVHNTDMTENGGREVTVSGVAFLKALFSGNYSSPDFDNLAVPFYLYAKDYCQPAAILTLFTVVALVLTLILSGLGILFTAVKREYAFSLLAAVFSALSAILTIALYAVALSMKNGDILATYCGGNPACSIRSDVIWGVILSVLMLAGSLYAAIRYLKLRSIKRAR